MFIVENKATLKARIYLWDYKEKIIVSDIDGTITKSDALGHLFTMVGKDWTHLGVAKLFSEIYRNGYKFMYLTSRAIGQSYSTKEYLKNVTQEKYRLPEGPVIMSPDRLFKSFHREVILKQPQVFKMSCLKDIMSLFSEDSKIRPFYAGFGNRITDALSYRSVNIPKSRIFTIEYKGDIKLELIYQFTSSYIKLNDLVDHFFPPLSNHNYCGNNNNDNNNSSNKNNDMMDIDDEDCLFNDLNYWKDPLPDIDVDLDINGNNSVSDNGEEILNNNEDENLDLSSKTDLNNDSDEYSSSNSSYY